MLTKPNSFFTMNAVSQMEIIKAAFAAIAVGSQGHPAWIEIYGQAVETFNMVQDLDIKVQQEDFPYDAE